MARVHHPHLTPTPHLSFYMHTAQNFKRINRIQLFFSGISSLFIFLRWSKMVCRRSEIMHGKKKMREGKREMGGGLVHKKVKKLQKIIPGGQGLKPDNLLLRTADYILFLRLQINMLQCLSKVYTP
ncbi:transcription factor IBH1 [Olea europaea var. sylvestris]|uniref:transcription factor IBH1 n=1 Tax=Olea europaea var. sylvestris TaxID=158386 RepID=UPI000C1D06EF|nr:transcription factor IBH1 [Olea europaea var. sylvestris]